MMPSSCCRWDWRDTARPVAGSEGDSCRRNCCSRATATGRKGLGRRLGSQAGHPEVAHSTLKVRTAQAYSAEGCFLV
jgi:hypothetical protein